MLVVEGRVVSPAVVAAMRQQRRRGLLGLDGFEGAMWFPKTRSIHTFGMKFSIDVAFVGRHRRVLRVLNNLSPNRLPLPCFGAQAVFEAEAGSFESWGVFPGSHVEVLD